MTQRQRTSRLLSNQSGTVTAEFALVLPSVALMLAFLASLGAIQVQTLRLAAATSWAARESAISTANLDSSPVQERLVAEASRIAGDSRLELTQHRSDSLVCVVGKVPAQLLWAEPLKLTLAQEFCARDRGRP